MTRVFWWLPDEFEWPAPPARPRGEYRDGDPDTRRFRIYLRFRLPEMWREGAYRWAIRAFGWEVAWIHRSYGLNRSLELQGGYAIAHRVNDYDPDRECHWPRPRWLREGIPPSPGIGHPGGWTGLGGHWWQTW